jgi:hypothetical protein
LTPLQGHVAVIHASSLFHLFDEARQLQLAQAFASLLSPLPGSLILGMHVGLAEKGFRSRPNSDHKMFCHSPETWRELWVTKVFKPGTVDVKAVLKEFPIPGNPTLTSSVLIWSVTRL